MIRLAIYGAIITAILAAFGVYHHAVYKSGVDDAHADQMLAIHKACGDQAKEPKDCYAAGVESVKAEFAGKIEAANTLIQQQDVALTSANASIDKLRADSARRSKIAADKIAALEAMAGDAAQRLSAVLAAQPIPGETPCVSACSLLRSFQF